MASVVPMRALRVLHASRTPLGHAATTSAVRLPCWAAVSVRYASSASSSSSRPTTTAATSTTTIPPTIIAATAPVLAHNAANPPETTRPPPLHLPVRGPDSSTLSHLMASGKAYLAFYKTGLRYLYANWKLVRALTPATSTSTRSDLLLRRRWSHDLRRLPLFAVLLVVCGECTPLVVIVFPHIVPYPCRIPKQVDKLQRLAEQRRHAAFVEHASPAVHIARSLGLVSPLWDHLGWIPASIAHSATTRRLHFLAQDDALLRQSGGVPALEPAEVVLACIDRGLDVRGLDDDRLRQLLAAWLDRTASPSSDPTSDRLITLLTKRPDEWPEVE